MSTVTNQAPQPTSPLAAQQRIDAFLASRPDIKARITKGLADHKRRGGNFADTDFYEFTMWQILHKYFGHLGATLESTFRSPVKITQEIFDEYKRRLELFAQNCHSLDKEMVPFLKKLPYLDDDCIDHLADWSQPKFLFSDVELTLNNNELHFKASGPAERVCWWEEPAMHLCSEVIFDMTGYNVEDDPDWVQRAYDKWAFFKQIGATVAEFGTRRRRSLEVQLGVLEAAFADNNLHTADSRGGLMGTSNVMLGYWFNTTLIGTMAHKLFMILGAVYGYDIANYLVIAIWKYEYGNLLGYYLPDTYGSDTFYPTLDHDTAILFSGPRQDSGSPEEETDRAIDNLLRLGLSRKQIRFKTIVYSDNLNPTRVGELRAYAQKAGINDSFGVGTNLTFDLRDKNGDKIKPLNMVIKATAAWVMSRPDEKHLDPDVKVALNLKRFCVKWSDSPGKHMGNPETLAAIEHWRKTGQVTWVPLLPWPKFLPRPATMLQTT